MLECRRLVSWSYCEAGKELSCLQWHLTDNCHPIYLSPRLAKKCMFDKQICNCELLKPVAESAFNCELKASLPGGGGSPSLYSCQLDAVVGDVREATSRRARGWAGGVRRARGGGGWGEATQDLHWRSSGQWREHGLTRHQKSLSQGGLGWISEKYDNASLAPASFHMDDHWNKVMIIPTNTGLDFQIILMCRCTDVFVSFSNPLAFASQAGTLSKMTPVLENGKDCTSRIYCIQFFGNICEYWRSLSSQNKGTFTPFQGSAQFSAFRVYRDKKTRICQNQTHGPVC